VGAGLTLAGKLPEKHDLDGKPETNYVHRDMNVEEGLHCKLANILPMFDFLSNFYQSNLNLLGHAKTSSLTLIFQPHATFSSPLFNPIERKAC